MKNNIIEPNKMMRHEFHRPGDGRKAFLLSTPKAVTPYAGLVTLLDFFQHLGLPAILASLMPFSYASPNAIGPVNILIAFLLSVALGAKRFAHLNGLRSDTALLGLLGWKRWPSADATLSFFARFDWKQIELFFPPLTAWLLGKLAPQTASLDLDSTVFERYGNQQGAKKGYNPRKPGHHSHHPLVAVLAEPLFILHGWLRSGNTTAGRGVLAFLTEALQLVPATTRLRCVRADSGFFDARLLDFLEEKNLHYIIVARMNSTLKRRCAGLRHWRDLDANYSAGEFHEQLHGWKHARRFVVVRERVRDEKHALGRPLIDVPGYTYRVFVTDLDAPPEEAWRDYNQRACIEQRILELKDDYGADGFCRQDFFATEAAFRAVLTLFNLLSLWQTATRGEDAPHQRLTTLRAQVFTCGAIAGRVGHTYVLHMSTSWGGLETRKPLMDKAKQWCEATTTRLPRSPEQTEPESAKPSPQPMQTEPNAPPPG